MKLCYYSATGMELPILGQAIIGYRERGGTLNVIARAQAQLFDQARITAFVEQAIHASVLVITLQYRKASCPAFDQLMERLQALRDAGAAVPYLHIQTASGDEEGMLLAQQFSDGMATGDWQRLRQYFSYGGRENYLNALAFLDARLNGAAEPAEARPMPTEGLYHPDHGYCADVDEYMRAGQPVSGIKPTVGIWFFQSNWANGTLAHIDACIRAIEARGAHALPVFSMRVKFYPGAGQRGGR